MNDIHSSFRRLGGHIDGRKTLGQFFTPDYVARSLVSWAKRTPDDRMLDPSCGDGRFLELHHNSVGIEQDVVAHSVAQARVPSALVHQGDFFSWARQTTERFDFAVGNPPFIRYQRFNGRIRRTALDYCRSLGANFSALTSSWAPFLVATSSLLVPGGRLAFVVPAEIGHAPYAQPLLDYLMRHFRLVHVVAIKKKLFPNLSEDAWLLYANGYSIEGIDCELRFAATDCFKYCSSPPIGKVIGQCELELWRNRIRPFLLPEDLREMYQELVQSKETFRLGEVAQVGIGYVTGANDFFHLRPSAASKLRIPQRLLQPTVRTSKLLPNRSVTWATVSKWLNLDEPSLLLRLGEHELLPSSVRRYLDSPEGQIARSSYKCRSRSPWYSVPNVTIPHGFLSYMSSRQPLLVANQAHCSCTNSVHTISMKKGNRLRVLQRSWSNDVVALSCEVEGHPLGGGVLKVEPREAARVLVPYNPQSIASIATNIREATSLLRSWRHCAST